MNEKYLTIGKLREQINGLSDDVIVTVSCENRCEPHPITGGFFTPTSNSVRDRVGIPRTPITIVVLWQDEGADVMREYEDDDDE
jgi:hypothetical protein